MIIIVMDKKYNNMTTLKLLFTGIMGVLFLITSCTKDLDQYPSIETTSEEVYTSVEGYQSALAKLYASFAVAGNGSGDDVPDMDGSTASWGYLRVYFNLQEIPTDETICTGTGADHLVDMQLWRLGA